MQCYSRLRSLPRLVAPFCCATAHATQQRPAPRTSRAETLQDAHACTQTLGNTILRARHIAGRGIDGDGQCSYGVNESQHQQQLHVTKISQLITSDTSRAAHWQGMAAINL